MTRPCNKPRTKPRRRRSSPKRLDKNITDDQIHALLATRGQIALIWSLDDVLNVRPSLTHKQAWEVLEHARQEHDAECGITWDILGIHADNLFS